MLGEKLRKMIVGQLVKTLICVLLLVLTLNWAQSQVTIVPGKPKEKAARPAAVKTKPKPKPKPTPAAVSKSAPTSKPVSTLRPPSELTEKPPSFVLFPPQLEPTPAINLGMATTSALALPLPKLVSYIFDVVTLDDRGRVSERRAETTRYYTEDLSMGVQLDMVEIPGGTYPMGSLESDFEEIRKDYVRGIEKELRDTLVRRLQWETPQHLVKIPAFYMSKYEVTQSQWRMVANLPKVNRVLVSDPSRFKGSNRPVEKVSWEDAVEFCERLSRATGRRYRLPSEAEWEYACRAGTSSQFHFGASVKTDLANYHGKYNYGSVPKGEYRSQTVPVGSLAGANAFGLYDMHGNVWEWCLDTWHDSYAGAPVDARAWEGTGTGVMYIKSLRGGSWDTSAGECRSTSRNRSASTVRLHDIGFRVIAEAPSQQPTNDTSISLK